MLFRRRRKTKRDNLYDDDIAGASGPYGVRPLSAAATSSAGASSNARPLVAPLRPASKMGEEDPNMVYAPYQPSQSPSPHMGYYEDMQPPPGQYAMGQYYPTMGGAAQDEMHGSNPAYSQHWSQYDASTESSERHVPHLVDNNPHAMDVPHSRG